MRIMRLLNIVACDRKRMSPLCKIKKPILVASVVSLSSCMWQPQQIVPRPTDVNIGNAILQIRKALVKAQDLSAKSHKYAGYYPCTATAVFNVTAGAGKTLVLDAAIKPAISVAPSLSATNTSASNASVGNQITVVLTSSICAPTNSNLSSNKKSSKKSSGLSAVRASRAKRPVSAGPSNIPIPSSGLFNPRPLVVPKPTATK
jgi:hypothetical protein